ncbi:hypothetical protein BGZ57DRAFT_595066 [Hyaloscypha finlandica]|nr:hypothetical protein BGZ57DRAFT_595066 [Hyaloscypha finlandica]
MELRTSFPALHLFACSLTCAGVAALQLLTSLIGRLSPSFSKYPAPSTCSLHEGLHHPLLRHLFSTNLTRIMPTLFCPIARILASPTAREQPMTRK